MSDGGRLLVCATPIGNLGDVTARVLDALREATVIVAEDTRVTRKLLARYDIHTPLERYDEATAAARTPELVERISAGARVALVSDAGTPGISDPGERLVDACLLAGLPVDVLPGASAIVTALVASGLPTRAFYFGGFLPRKAGELRRTLESLSKLEATLIFYESPRRTAATVSLIAEVFPARRAAMARELTKLHEEVLRGTTVELAASLDGRELKGEVVLLVGPPVPEEAPAADDAAVRAAVERLVSEGLTRKDAVKRVAAESGVPRNDVYRIALG
ncbi:MAG: 16S rRNA (cytidine(1402)-2'-O)-methyltransferase [Actinobacteria bacterium HGW-Actinobacteria-1]|jgi:16S rRNA (cytidine1402-2'-O)-methyltransferase|nr:MAG: 16S rRNA (cytidine(1402)-2'-O)-methyltransferase [Actinobacteria bacterium HGW-Actinobacteria-1]